MSPDELREQALELLRTAAKKAKRSGNVAFPPSFVLARDGTEEAPRLAKLIQGGRGGEVRLKLYLSITMMATSEPYDLRTTPTPRSWARLLALPSDTGPRRITNNLNWLKNNEYISLERRGANTPAIRLLDAEGGGGKYTRPITQGQGRYVGVPIEFWTQGWILNLSAVGIALMLVLMEHQGGHTEARYVTQNRRERYGLSSDSWTRARKELEGHGLLTVKRIPQGGVFDYERLRNSYWVNLERLKSAPRPKNP